jgi:anaerobic magnesium-protoporphyrin IX monomethyl ester cyclase
MITKIMLIEPPKDYWFLMGEYMPPPTPLLVLAAYIEKELTDVDIEIIDCQAERKDWKDIKRDIESFSPSIVATTGFTCNAYACARVVEIAKRVDKSIVTVLGGLHFSATAEESLNNYPEIDYIIRGEGEVTFVELIKSLRKGKKFHKIKGLSFKHNGKIVHTPDRPLIENLDSLPYPAYHLVEKKIKNYHFVMMAGRNKKYLILEGSRGCNHKCTFCSQWKHWNGTWRKKSARRIADEMEHVYDNFGGEFLWLTDDNFGYGKRAKELWEELRKRKFTEDISWFFQARTDDIANHPDLVAKLREVGNTWILVGVENHSSEVLKEYKKGIKVKEAYKAIKTLKENDIFSQSMMVMGSRKDTRESIEQFRQFSMDLDTDLAIYSVLTPLPGTDVYENAKRNGWIMDDNYSNYDMVHAVMPTETLSREQVQEELYLCYKRYYGSIPKNIAGFFSKNEIKRRTYRHMAGKSVLSKLRRLI